MAIDLSENGEGYNDLKHHIGHKIVCVGYEHQYASIKSKKIPNPQNVAIECETCGCVLVDFDRPEKESKPVVKGFATK